MFEDNFNFGILLTERLAAEKRTQTFSLFFNRFETIAGSLEYLPLLEMNPGPASQPTKILFILDWNLWLPFCLNSVDPNSVKNRVGKHRPAKSLFLGHQAPNPVEDLEAQKAKDEETGNRVSQF